jgi:peptide methionine sulfoxide reductase MsrB
MLSIVSSCDLLLVAFDSFHVILTFSSTPPAGYFLKTSFIDQIKANPDATITFYDSNNGKPLFAAPRSRSMDEFLTESRNHGWPSFRDDEVIWENVRILPDGEAVSVHGTHLGHNLPDQRGARYCINLVSVAGRPKK